MCIQGKNKYRYVCLVAILVLNGVISYFLLPSVARPSIYLRYNNLIHPADDYADQISDDYSVTVSLGITDENSPFRGAYNEEKKTGTGLWWEEIDTDSGNNHVLITLKATVKNGENVEGVIDLESNRILSEDVHNYYEFSGNKNNLIMEMSDGSSINVSDWLTSLIQVPTEDDISAMNKEFDSDPICPLISLTDSNLSECIRNERMTWVPDIMYPEGKNKWFDFLGDSSFVNDIRYKDDNTGKEYNLNVGIQRRFNFEPSDKKRGGTKGQYLNGILNQFGFYEVDDSHFMQWIGVGY